MEHYLLYYGWEWSEEIGEPCTRLNYCASIGKFDSASAEAFAEEHRLNYYDQSGRWCSFRGFIPDNWSSDEEPDDGFYGVFYEMRASQSLPEVLKFLCAEAMVRFDDAKSRTDDDDIKDMLEIIRQASLISTAAGKKVDSDTAPRQIASPESPLVLSASTDLIVRAVYWKVYEDIENYHREKLAFEQAFGEFPKDPPPVIELDPKKPKENAEKFLETHFSCQSIRTLIHYLGDYYQWKENVYRKIEVAVIKRDLMHFLEQAVVQRKEHCCTFGRFSLDDYERITITAPLLNGIEQMLQMLVLRPASETTPCWIGGNDCEQPASVKDASQLIFGKSKILNLADMSTLPPSPHWFNTAALDYDYDPAAECPQWDAFLDSSLGNDEESKATIMEFIGLCLTPITKFQKALFLKGPIRSGKGTIARIAQAVIGKHNYSAQSMQDFGQRFGFETFLGKTFVSVSDARSSKKQWTSHATEKILNITGEDTVKVDIKHKTAVNVRLQTKLLFMSNLLPTIPDSSGALPTRFIYVKMLKSFFREEDVELEQKLLGELPGILNLAIRHLHNLLERGEFIQPESGKVLAERMLGLSSPINEFVRQIKPYALPDSIWEEWNQFCEDEERPPGKQSDLWDAIGAAGYDADFDAARIMAKIRQLGGEATARDLRDCSRRFKNSSVLDAKLDSMVKLGLLKVRITTAENHVEVKIYSVTASAE